MRTIDAVDAALNALGSTVRTLADEDDDDEEEEEARAPRAVALEDGAVMLLTATVVSFPDKVKLVEASVAFLLSNALALINPRHSFSRAFVAHPCLTSSSFGVDPLWCSENSNFHCDT